MQTIAVIGAGFTGAMVAIHLARHGADLPIRVVLIERTGRFGRGIAYGTSCPSHLLNVPAGRMSAFADRPDHFLEWLRAREPGAEGGSFVPRMVFGEYIESLLEDAARSGAAIERVRGEAVAVERDGAGDGGIVRLADGRAIRAARIVLALGNFPPADPLSGLMGENEPRYIADPWGKGWLDDLDRVAPVLLIGTGLTMVDMALELRARGHTGSIHAISRRGLLPQPHRTPPKRHHLDAPATMALWPATALGILRGLRREVERAGRRGINWREVVTSIRHETPELWRRLDERERQRFLVHLRAFWETHRHRTSPEAAAAINDMRRAGQLRVMAGRMTVCSSPADSLRVTMRRRGSDEIIGIHCQRVVNCTGPETNLARVTDPLIVQLRKAGLIRADALGLGLDTDGSGAVIGADGRPATWLFAAGPLRKGALWETTAVPELRVQAAEVAARVFPVAAGSMAVLPERR